MCMSALITNWPVSFDLTNLTKGQLLWWWFVRCKAWDMILLLQDFPGMFVDVLDL